MPALLKLRSFATISCIALVFCTALVNAQYDDPIENSIPCHTTQLGMYYNFSAIAGTQISGADAAQQWHFYLNLCNVAPACIRDGAMACQISATNPNDQYDVAFPNDDIAIHYWTLIPGGVQLVAYGSGIFCHSQHDQRKALVNIYCDRRYTDAVTTFSAPVVEGPPCTYTMTINHTSACGSPLVNTTRPPPTTLPGPSTDQTEVTAAGLGVGISIGIVVTTVGVLVFAYVVRRGGVKGKWNQMDEVTLGKMGTTTGDKEASNM